MRSRLWLYLPDEVDEDPILGRVRDEEGWELDNGSPEVVLVEANADFRSVCRLFWNQTVTDRSSLYSGHVRVKRQRVISKPESTIHDSQGWGGEKKRTNRTRSQDSRVAPW